MKSLVFAAAAVAIGLAAAAVPPAVFGDRTFLAAPPEARANAFVHQLKARRAELAVRYLSDRLRETTPAGALQRRFDALGDELGEIRRVEASTVHSDRRVASSRASLQGGTGVTLPLEFALEWERGQWAISELPHRLGGASRPR